jgi:hypothetical protein
VEKGEGYLIHAKTQRFIKKIRNNFIPIDVEKGEEY